MKKLRAIIIDDQQYEIDRIETIAKEIELMTIVKTYTNPKRASNELEGIDLILLDMEMPELNGIQFLDIIQTMKVRPMVIAISGFPEYALPGYDYELSDFVPKPADFRRLRKAVQRVYDKVFSPPISSAPPLVSINIERSQVLIREDEIVYVEGAGNFIKIYMIDDSKPYMPFEKLSSFYERLSGSLLQVHRSYLVGIKHIKGYKRNRIEVSKPKSKKEAHSGEYTNIPLGDEFRNDFFARINGKNKSQAT